MYRADETTEQNPIQERCRAEVYIPARTPWKAVRQDIMRIEQAAFGVHAFREASLQRDFTDEATIVVLLRDTDTGTIVGFTYAEPGGNGTAASLGEPETTAYINNTALDPAYHGQQLVGVMMRLLEQELIAHGYTYVERDAAVANQYAANIQKAYGERIVAAIPHDSRYGPQIFFRIRL